MRKKIIVYLDAYNTRTIELTTDKTNDEIMDNIFEKGYVKDGDEYILLNAINSIKIIEYTSQSLNDKFVPNNYSERDETSGIFTDERFKKYRSGIFCRKR